MHIRKGRAVPVVAALAMLVTTAGAAMAGASHHPAATGPIGPVPPGQAVEVSLPLRTLHPAQLSAMIERGGRTTPAAYARTYAPRPAAVAEAVRVLRADGLVVAGTGATGVVTATGTAGAMERTFGVRLEAYRTAQGWSYHAPLGVPHLPPAVAAVASSVIGLDTQFPAMAADVRDEAQMGADGYSPQQVMQFYNFGPLRQAGLDGAGQTVLFLEIDQFQQSDLDRYAQEFGLSPFNVEVHESPSFGAPAKTEGEADLDVQIVHAIAPAAKEVVYYAGAELSQGLAAYAAMIKAYPHAILSDSIGSCEQAPYDYAKAVDVYLKEFAATGGTVLNSAGDAGAYNCAKFETVSQWNPAQQKPNVSSPADDPYVTAIGGTSIFPDASGDYGRETVWGNPVEQAGGGGGLSPVWPRPSWQTGPGVVNATSNGMRQVPDVSSLADTNTGWDICIQGQFQPIGGTSTGAPLWAGLAALADQALAAHGKRSIGFANPVLYAFASDPTGLPAPHPFHDVTVGNNLFYSATPGWDFATGLGTPDASSIVDDLLAREPSA